MFASCQENMNITPKRESGDKSLCDNKESKLEKKQGEKESE